jgi:hypothetical protein
MEILLIAVGMMPWMSMTGFVFTMSRYRPRPTMSPHRGDGSRFLEGKGGKGFLGFDSLFFGLFGPAFCLDFSFPLSIS